MVREEIQICIRTLREEADKVVGEAERLRRAKVLAVALKRVNSIY